MPADSVGVLADYKFWAQAKTFEREIRGTFGFYICSQRSHVISFRQIPVDVDGRGWRAFSMCELRRRPGVFAGLVLICVLLVASPAGAVLTDPITPGTLKVKWAPFVTIPSADGGPQDLTPSGDGTGRLFVSTRNGRIRVVDSAGSLSPTTFLNVANGGVSMFTSGEGGFSGLAFSPNYLSSGKFYSFTTETYNGSSPVDFSHPEMLPNAGGITPANHIVIREWTAAGNPATATTANTTSRVLMRINHPQNNHQGGGLKFGPDGNLYISLGDGGGGNDFNGTKGSVDGHSNTA